jgi:GT2 family glycosyltransferase
MKNDLVSILIVNDDHPPDLKRFFDALMFQNKAAGNFEIIFIEILKDPLYEEIEHYIEKNKPKNLNVIIHHLDQGSRSKGYNKAMELAEGDLYLFFGDDYIAPPTLVESHRTFHHVNEEDFHVGIGSAILPYDSSTSHFGRWLEESGELYGVPFIQGMTEINPKFFYIGNSSVKKSFIEKSGTFNELYPYHTWDDYELSLRMIKNGMKSSLLPEAQAEHIHPIGFGERCAVMIKSGYSARFYERTTDNKENWDSFIKKSYLTYLLMTIKYALLFCMTWREKYRGSVYKSILGIYFKIGYNRNTSG